MALSELRPPALGVGVPDMLLRGPLHVEKAQSKNHRALLCQNLVGRAGLPGLLELLYVLFGMYVRVDLPLVCLAR